MSSWSVSRSLKESADNGKPDLALYKFFSSLLSESSWLLSQSLKVFLYQSPFLLPFQSKRCSMIKTWWGRWKPAKPWVEPTTFALTKLVPSQWTKWPCLKFGTSNPGKSTFIRKPLKKVTYLQINNTMNYSKLPQLLIALQDFNLKKKVPQLKSLSLSTSREWELTPNNTRANMMSSWKCHSVQQEKECQLWLNTKMELISSSKVPPKSSLIHALNGLTADLAKLKLFHLKWRLN